MKTIITAIVVLVFSSTVSAAEKAPTNDRKQIESWTGGITAYEVSQLIDEIDEVLSKDQQGFTAEEVESMQQKFEELPVVTKLDKLENGRDAHQAVRAALIEGVIHRASGVSTPIVTPRVAAARALRNTDLVKLAKAEREVDQILNPSLWERVKWWWNN